MNDELSLVRILLKPEVLGPLVLVVTGGVSIAINKLFNRRSDRIKDAQEKTTVDKSKIDIETAQYDSIKKMVEANNLMIGDLTIKWTETRESLEKEKAERRSEKIEADIILVAQLKEIKELKQCNEDLMKRTEANEESIRKLQRLNEELEVKAMESATKLAQAYLHVCLVPDCKKRKKNS